MGILWLVDFFNYTFTQRNVYMCLFTESHCESGAKVFYEKNGCINAERHHKCYNVIRPYVTCINYSKVCRCVTYTLLNVKAVKER